MSTYISGGCKNGKSGWAQRIAKARAEREDAPLPLYYVATMIPTDGEDRARVLRHRQEREGWGFVTLEQGRDVLRALDVADPRGVFLLDSVTALLANEMFPGAGEIRWDAGSRVADALMAFARRAPNTVFVSDYIFSDALLYDETTEAYRRALAHVDRRMAQCCDNVLEIVYGQAIVHKGVLPL